MSSEPIFVVGVPRSGTTLLAAMLAAHSRLSCGPETHAVRWLSRTDSRPICDPETWPRSAAEFIASIRPSGVQSGNNASLLEQYQIDDADVIAYLLGKEPTIANALSAVPALHMEARGKKRWVEKTPDHLGHVATIREHFPRSPIIRIVRDPRDVALSLTTVPWGASSFLDGLLYWERLHRASRDFFATDGMSHTLQFEDLLLTPAAELRKVCEFVGEEFEDGMLDTSRTGTEVNGERAPWKRKAREAVDVARVAAWRSRLTEPENQLAEAVLGDQIEALGYPRQAEFSRFGTLYPNCALAARHAPALAAVAARGVRFWKERSDERSTATTYVGDPGSREWLGESRTGRALRALPILVDVGRAFVFREIVYWIPDRPDAWRGWLSFALRQFLSRYEVDFNQRGPGRS